MRDSCQDMIEILYQMEPGICATESWKVEAIVQAEMSGDLGRGRGHRGA